MTKDFQNSDLPKSKEQPLKHSQSTDDIPLTEPSELENKISVLELKLETKDRELTEKNQTIALYSNQLDNKQQEIESLRKQKEELNSKLTATTQQLDNSFQARHEAIKQFGIIYDQLQKIKQELDENIDQASNELVSQDQTITKLRTNQSKAQLRIQDLEKDLNLATRLAELRKDPLPNDYPNLDTVIYLKVALYLGISVVTIWLLTKDKE